MLHGSPLWLGYMKSLVLFGYYLEHILHARRPGSYSCVYNFDVASWMIITTHAAYRSWNMSTTILAWSPTESGHYTALCAFAALRLSFLEHIQYAGILGLIMCFTIRSVVMSIYIIEMYTVVYWLLSGVFWPVAAADNIELDNGLIRVRSAKLWRTRQSCFVLVYICLKLLVTR